LHIIRLKNKVSWQHHAIVMCPNFKCTCCHCIILELEWGNREREREGKRKAKAQGNRNGNMEYGKPTGQHVGHPLHKNYINTMIIIYAWIFNNFSRPIFFPLQFFHVFSYILHAQFDPYFILQFTQSLLLFTLFHARSPTHRKRERENEREMEREKCKH
jgi:hypothetical protein